jgi:CRP/FNR family transcriptional regulator, cyclic AMP receptor protein
MNAMPPWADVLGWAAAALTLLAFSCDNLLRLRCTALAANAAFISYGIAAELWPVVALHCVLVPINGWRLLGHRRSAMGVRQMGGRRHPSG